MNIPDYVIDAIRKEGSAIGYGSITINLNEEGDFIDIVCTKRVRYPKKAPRAGDLVSPHRTFIVKKQ